jgi:phage tail-like protein
MADREPLIYPYTAFSFSVEIYPDGDSAPLVGAAFAECDGLEMTMDVKTIRQGGANDRAYRVAGPVNYGNVTLKRGMTNSYDLWKWFQRCVANPSLRAEAEIVLTAPDGARTERARFQLQRCLPIKLKAPPLNAKDGQVAIEELQIAYEKFELGQIRESTT